MPPLQEIKTRNVLFCDRMSNLSYMYEPRKYLGMSETDLLVLMATLSVYIKDSPLYYSYEFKEDNRDLFCNDFNRTHYTYYGYMRNMALFILIYHYFGEVPLSKFFSLVCFHSYPNLVSSKPVGIVSVEGFDLEPYERVLIVNGKDLFLTKDILDFYNSFVELTTVEVSDSYLKIDMNINELYKLSAYNNS